jgi:hypothetical protein
MPPVRIVAALEFGRSEMFLECQKMIRLWFFGGEMKEEVFFGGEMKEET